MNFPADLGLDSLRFYFDGDLAVKALEDLQIIPRQPAKGADLPCPNPNCENGVLTTEVRTDNPLGWRYRCRKRANTCNKAISPLTNTWLERAHLSPYKIMAVAMYFLEGMKCSRVQRNLHISSDTATNYYNFSSEVCAWQFRKKMVADGPIGGDGLHVEIDECYITRKYGKGRPTGMEKNKFKFIGAICAETKQVVGFLVPDCKKNTIWQFIRDWVLPGSIIHTDGAQIYAGLDEEENIQLHEVVIHKTGEYVRESTKEVGTLVTTNRIENVWKHVKKYITGRGNEEETKKQFYKALYFRFYINFVASPAERLNAFFRHVRNFYSLPLEEAKVRNYQPYILIVGRKQYEL